MTSLPFNFFRLYMLSDLDIVAILEGYCSGTYSGLAEYLALHEGRGRSQAVFATNDVSAESACLFAA